MSALQSTLPVGTNAVLPLAAGALASAPIAGGAPVKTTMVLTSRSAAI